MCLTTKFFEARLIVLDLFIWFPKYDIQHFNDIHFRLCTLMQA